MNIILLILFIMYIDIDTFDVKQNTILELTFNLKNSKGNRCVQNIKGNDGH